MLAQAMNKNRKHQSIRIDYWSKNQRQKWEDGFITSSHDVAAWDVSKVGSKAWDRQRNNEVGSLNGEGRKEKCMKGIVNFRTITVKSYYQK